MPVREIRRTALFTLAGNILLSAGKMAAGIVGRSQAVVADAVHSLSDMGTDAAVFMGAAAWSREADENHPYGHGRIETLATAFIGLVLAGAGARIGWTALARIGEKHPLPSWIAFWATCASIVAKEWMFRWTMAKGKSLKSRALVANAWHHRADALSSVPVAGALITTLLNPSLSFLDDVAALGVSIFILHAGGCILKTVVEEFLGTGTSRKNLRRMEELVLRVKGVRSLHALRSRRMGAGWFVDLHVQVDPEMSVREAHAVCREVEGNLLAAGPEVHDVLVHVEPWDEETREEGGQGNERREKSNA